MTNPPPRVFAWGVGVAALYLAVAAAGFRSGAVPVRILFDGVAPPPPYRWARPPQELAGGNQAPEVGTGTVSLDATGSVPASATTGDGQATVNVAGRAIPGERGEGSAVVRISPLDPASIGPPPQGLRFDGNAYRIEITYASSGKRSGRDVCRRGAARPALPDPDSLVVVCPLLGDPHCPRAPHRLPAPDRRLSPPPARVVSARR